MNNKHTVNRIVQGFSALERNTAAIPASERFRIGRPNVAGSTGDRRDRAGTHTLSQPGTVPVRRPDTVRRLRITRRRFMRWLMEPVSYPMHIPM